MQANRALGNVFRIVAVLGWMAATSFPGHAQEGAPLEGEWLTKRLVITEFPTIDIARAWYHSGLYQAAARKRQATSTGRVLLVGGRDRPW